MAFISPFSGLIQCNGHNGQWRCLCGELEALTCSELYEADSFHDSVLYRGPGDSVKIGNRHQATGNSNKTASVIFTIGALPFALSLPAEAQQLGKIPRIGVVWGSTPQAEKDRLAALQRGLRELGYFEGKNILIEHRYAEGKLDKSPEIVAQLLALNVDVFVAAPDKRNEKVHRGSLYCPIGSTSLTGRFRPALFFGAAFDLINGLWK